MDIETDEISSMIAQELIEKISFKKSGDTMKSFRNGKIVLEKACDTVIELPEPK